MLTPEQLAPLRHRLKRPLWTEQDKQRLIEVMNKRNKTHETPTS